MTTPLHAEPVWRTVPVEPTEAMIDAWHEAVAAGIFGTNGGDGQPYETYIRTAYRAMLAAAPAPDGKREAVEIVTEWLAMAEAVPTQTHGVLRYPPISQGELDAIALLAALRPTDTGEEA